MTEEPTGTPESPDMNPSKETPTVQTFAPGDGAEGAEEAAPKNNLVGKTLAGRYELLELLGSGPLLAAYRSRDRVANRLVTVKVLLPEFAADDAIRNDLKTGLSRTLSLTHNHIARVFDVGTDEETDTLFLAEEYVRGIDLKERIRRVAPLQLNAATEKAIAIAEALETAHARGIAHGDIRPQNILISQDGQVKVTGFGSATAQARVIVRDSHLLEKVAGYVAPDAARNAVPTPSADLYALGVILYEMLTGNLPYSAETPVQTALRHAQDPIPSPQEINIGVPAALDGIVRKSLGKTPETRYSNASELLQDLRAVRDGLRFGKPLNWSPLEPPTQPAPPFPQRTAASSDDAPARPRPVPAVPAAGSSAVISQEPRNEASTDGDPDGISEETVIMPGRGGSRSRKEAVVYEDEPPRGSGIGKWLTFINLFLALILVGAVGYLIYIGSEYVKPSGEVVIPELVGKTMTDVETLAIDKNFKIEVVAREYREKEPKDVVFRQNVTPGRRIKEGKTVGVWVSNGPRMVTMPDVRSMAVQRARRLIENRGLTLGQVTNEFDPLEPRGNVIRQSPQPDENIPRGTKVDLVLSRGEEPLPTPEPLPPVDVPSYSEVNPEPTPTPLERYFKISYDVPDDGQEHIIRIDVFDSEGPRTVFNESVQAGTKFSQEKVRTVGNNVTIKVFDNDELASELTKTKPDSE
ncbi:MAG: Stk1 family PASTA domain-containing Ser/Thr kinase [Armatimonadaceae bacterium]